MKLRKTATLLVCCLWAANGMWAQRVSVSFPALAEKEIFLYYFSGARADTLAATLDKSGKAVFTLPGKDYRGIIVLGNREQGLVELALAEPLLEVECRDATLNLETVVCKNSAENDYLKRIFSTQSQHIKQLGWLMQGEPFYAGLDAALVAGLEKAKTAAQQTLLRTKEENSRSTLFAARYYDAAEFMSRLYEAEQSADPQYFDAVREEMETTAPLAVIYRSGNRWPTMHNEYINVFNRINRPNNHREYAQSILRTLGRLQPPVYEAYLAGSIAETERFGWLDARDTILARVLVGKTDFKPAIPSLKLAVDAFRMRNGKIAPAIAGLPPQKGYEKMLVAFHDTDCNTCVNEMNTLVRAYGMLKEQKIRVVSIAADKNAAHFEAGTRDFPWTDKLCDLQGFEGENFRAFGVAATPTFFVVGKDGRIEQEYHSVEEVVATGQT